MPAKFAKEFEKEMPNSDSDWDYPLTEEDLRAIDSVISSAPPPKRHHEDEAAAHSPPKIRRRLPNSLFAFQQQRQRNINTSLVPFSPCSSRSYYRRNSAPVSPFQGNCKFYYFILSIPAIINFSRFFLIISNSSATVSPI